jgi:hypothetical protein
MARKLLTGVDLNNQRGLNCADPSAATDIANKQYVDNFVEGKSLKQPVDVATTAAGTLASSFENGDSVDGVTLTTGMSILIKDQVAGAENGLYTVAVSGAPTRRSDANGTGDLTGGTTVYVRQGTVNGDKQFSITSPNTDVTIGTTAQVWGQTGGSSGTTYTAGNGLTESPAGTFNVGAGTGITVGADTVGVDTSVVARKYAANVGNGSSTSIAVNHALGTRDVVVSVHDSSTFEEVECDVVKTDTNNVTLTFVTAPASNAYRCSVIG